MRALPFIVLVVSLVGVSVFADGFQIGHTVGVLVCSAAAGVALAVLAGRRRS